MLQDFDEAYRALVQYHANRTNPFAFQHRKGRSTEYLQAVPYRDPATNEVQVHYVSTIATPPSTNAYLIDRDRQLLPYPSAATPTEADVLQYAVEVAVYNLKEVLFPKRAPRHRMAKRRNRK